MSSLRILPDDIIFQHILIHLPPKVLVTFLTVSKKWLSTITHPTFIRMHLDHVQDSTSNSKSHMFFTPVFSRYQGEPPEHSPPCAFLHEDTLKELELELPQDVAFRFRIRFVGSVNGLVCFALDMAGFYAWNPFIRIGVEVPICPFSRDFMGHASYCLGFGFVPDTGDHKLIVFSYRDSPKHVYTYSFDADSWKQVQTPDELLEGFASNIPSEPVRGIPLDGNIYWLLSTEGSNPIKKIVSFNFEQECFGDTMLPNYKSEAPDDDFGCAAAFAIQVIKHSIHLSIIPHGRKHCHIWVLKYDRDTNVESWVKQCKIVFPEEYWSGPENNTTLFTGLMLNGWVWVCSFDNTLCRCNEEVHRYFLYDPEKKRFIDSKKSGCLYYCTHLKESLVGLTHREEPSGHFGTGGGGVELLAGTGGTDAVLTPGIDKGTTVLPSGTDGGTTIFSSGASGSSAILPSGTN